MKQLRGKDTVVDSTLKEVKAHGTEGFPFAVYLNDFSQFQTDCICWHWHDDAQITLITEGEFLCQVGSEKIVMQPGEIIFFNSFALHQIMPVKKASGKLYSFIWRNELLGGMGESDVYKNCIEPITASPLKYVYFGLSHPMNRQLHASLRGIINFTLEQNRFYELRVLNQLTKIWLRICEYIERNVARDQQALSDYLAKEKDEEKIKMALAYIEEHYDEKITLEAIAKAAMTNRSELCKCFRRVLDTTPNEFLIRYRLDKALSLLENPELRVFDIAELTGFCSPSHFGTHFMKYMGCTPLQYRKTILV